MPKRKSFFLVYGVLEQNELLLVGTVEKGGRVGVDLTGSGLALGWQITSFVGFSCFLDAELQEHYEDEPSVM